MKILIFGDIVGRVGRQGLTLVLPGLKKKYQPDLVLGNAENLAHGVGVTPSTLQEVLDAGVDFCTSGNHVFDKPDVLAMFEDKSLPLIRPANYPPGTPGRGSALVPVGKEQVLVINLMGRVFMREDFDDPFRGIDAILEEYRDVPRAGTLVDFHCEVTSERVAFGLYVDGRVSAVTGTHTHVPTADSEILPGGTAYRTDIGMTGAKGTVIGVDKVNVIRKFLTQRPAGFEQPERGICRINASLVTIDLKTQKATAIESIYEEVEVI